MRKNYFILLLLLFSFIIFTETFAENEEPNVSHNEESDVSHENKLLQLENNIQDFVDRSEDMLQRYSKKHESVIQKHIEDHKSTNDNFKNRADTIGSVTNTIAVVIAIIVGIIAFLTFVVTLLVPHYYHTISALEKTEKKSSIQNQMDYLMTRIQFGFVQQMLERSSRKIEDHDETDSIDSAKNVEAAYVLALQIRSILEEIRSSEKDVNIPVLCNRLEELSDMDTEKTWTKDVREYLYLLLSGEILNDASAKQAVKNLLRNL